MASHHEPLKALGPIDWADVDQDDLAKLLSDTLREAQVVIDSVPAATASAKLAAAETGRARAKTDSALVYANVQSSMAASAAARDAESPASSQLRREWKEVKTNPKENPHAISVFKLAGKDGRGAWFARRSVHDMLTFEQWRAGLKREFQESMKVQGAPGSGSIRGIGADRNVQHHDVDESSKLDVFHLSAQFPGPTAPRDFITMLLTSDAAPHQSDLRQYTIISKPCVHPSCPQRQGIIRGQYESVEVIREISIEADADAINKRSHSSADLVSAKGHEAAAGGDSSLRAVEWLMVTRSDPGGSVPRFLIEKGTPPGIIGDAGKFLDWVSRKTSRDGTFHESKEATSQPQQELSHEDADAGSPSHDTAGNPAPQISLQSSVSAPEFGHGQDEHGYTDWIPSSTGLYGIITGAFGVATSVATGLRQQLSGPLSISSSQDSLGDSQIIHEENEDGAGSDSDDSSTRSFSSALERSMSREKPSSAGVSFESNASDENKAHPGNTDKELQKLAERRRKLEESFSKMQERMETKRLGDKDKDEAAQAKLKEKHDRELAKQEAKYQREMQRLEEKRVQEERKAEARRVKAAERQEKSNLTLELEKARAERDVARREVDLLQVQVGELQAQNTALVAKMGRMTAGTSRPASASSKDMSVKS